MFVSCTEVMWCREMSVLRWPSSFILIWMLDFLGTTYRTSCSRRSTWRSKEDARGQADHFQTGLGMLAVSLHPYPSRHQRLTYLSGVFGKMRVVTPSHTYTHPSYFLVVRASPITHPSLAITTAKATTRLSRILESRTATQSGPTSARACHFVNRPCVNSRTEAAWIRRVVVPGRRHERAQPACRDSWPAVCTEVHHSHGNPLC